MTKRPEISGGQEAKDIRETHRLDIKGGKQRLEVSGCTQDRDIRGR